ncbi:MAG: hypothetical protein LBM05_02395, partial [Endomicrobium sp.]|nr:hypothetical protein [Endomicrobium sp.]
NIKNFKKELQTFYFEIKDKGIQNFLNNIYNNQNTKHSFQLFQNYLSNILWNIDPTEITKSSIKLIYWITFIIKRLQGETYKTYPSSILLFYDSGGTGKSYTCDTILETFNELGLSTQTAGFQILKNNFDYPDREMYTMFYMDEAGKLKGNDPQQNNMIDNRPYISELKGKDIKIKQTNMILFGSTNDKVYGENIRRYSVINWGKVIQKVGELKDNPNDPNYTNLKSDKIIKKSLKELIKMITTFKFSLYAGHIESETQENTQNEENLDLLYEIILISKETNCIRVASIIELADKRNHNYQYNKKNIINLLKKIVSTKTKPHQILWWTDNKQTIFKRTLYFSSIEDISNLTLENSSQYKNWTLEDLYKYYTTGERPNKPTKETQKEEQP